MLTKCFYVSNNNYTASLNNRTQLKLPTHTNNIFCLLIIEDSMFQAENV